LQKSRARLNEAQHSRNSSNNNKQTVPSKKSGIVGATAATTASIAQLNGTAAASTSATTVATLATTKAQASLCVTTTNFNNVTQSQRQPTSQSQLQLQSSLQLQSQASPKRATNVCVVRPQQQQQQLQQQQQQQQQLKQQQTKLTKKHPAPQPPPPPLYTHTPSLWQTPLLLDTTQKQQQQQQPQQQQQQQSNIVVATALVSPPISPASLPSPTVNAPPTAAVTAMVSPIVLPLCPAATAAAAAAAGAMSPPKGGSLPPSKFHHTTLAQHLQKVECLKKKKSLPLACQNSNTNSSNNNNNNNNIIVETLHKRQTYAGYNLTHPPPLMAFHTAVTGPAVTTVAVAAEVEQKKHSADAVDDNSDLNEIPVNVIFRKPPGLLACPADATVAAQSAMMKLGTVAPLTPPTPTTPASSAPLLGNVGMQLPAVGAVAAATPAFMPKSATSIPIISISTQNEQMSSKVAKRRCPAASAGCRKSNKSNLKADVKELPLAAIQQSEVVPPPVDPASSNRISRRRKPASGVKRSSAVLFSENEPLSLDDVPYCLQTRWLHASPSKDLAMESQLLQGNRDREERIAVRKGLLRRQALQLLSTRPLQELPMRAARQRLQGVQSLLLKYQDHANLQQGM